MLGRVALAVIALSLHGTASAQGQSTIVARGGKPFTETMYQMVQRQKSIPKIPKLLISTPPEHEQEMDERLVDPGFPRGVFIAPNVMGKGILAGTPGFAGVSLTDEFNLGSGFIPPDTTGAIGPNHFVEIINGAAAVYNRSTGARISLVSADTFFNIPGGVFPHGGSFDPRLLYDRRSGRWFACALDFGNDQFNHNGQICLAVSRTSDPTGVWDKYAFTAGIATAFTDYETLGVDDNGVYFGSVDFLDAGGVVARIFTTRKSTLLAGSPTLSTVTKFSPGGMYSTPMPATNLDAVGATAPFFFVASSNSVWGNINWAKVTWSGTTPSLSGTSAVSTATIAQPPAAPSSGSGTPIDSGDIRLQGAMIRNNRLWTCRTVGVNSTGTSTNATRSGCEWSELDVSSGSPTLVQQGRIFDPGATPRFYFSPSISVSGQGHATITFCGVKSTEFVSAYFAQRLQSDAAGVMGAITSIKAGGAAYTQLDGGGRNRWGDYALASVDPNDDMSIWTIQEYALNTANRWGTWIMQATAPAPTLNNPNGSGSPGSIGVVLNLTGTGFYDPGAGFSNRLAVQLLGGATNGISNYAVTYNSPTSATVTFNIAANASAGARDVKLTNPDGQSVTVVGGFTVNSGNLAPNADAGPDQNASVAADGTKPTIALDGSLSSDPNGDALTFEWKEGTTVLGNTSMLNVVMGAGVHTITLTVTDPFGASDTDEVVITVAGRATTLVASNVTTTIGATAHPKATLKAGTTVLVGKTVEFFVDGVSIGTAITNTSGLAQANYPVQPPPGTRSYIATFAGDDVNAAKTSNTATLTVGQGLTKVTITKTSAKVGANATLKATVKAGTIAIVGQTVTIKLDGVVVGTPTTNSLGVASVLSKVPEPAGAIYTITGEYAGDANFKSATGSSTLTATQASTKIVGEALTKPAGSPVNLGAKLTRTSDNTVLVGKTVDFYAADGVTFIASGVTDANGRASINVTAPAIGITTKYVVKFAGDSNYLAYLIGSATVKGS
jgi:hypothetical protein